MSGLKRQNLWVDIQVLRLRNRTTLSKADRSTSDSPTPNELRSIKNEFIPSNLQDLNKNLSAQPPTQIWTGYERVNGSHFKSKNPVNFISIDPLDFQSRHLYFESVVVSNLDGKLRNAHDNVRARECLSGISITAAVRCAIYGKNIIWQTEKAVFASSHLILLSPW